MVRGTLRPVLAGYARGFSGLTLDEAGDPVATVRVGARIVRASLYEWRTGGDA